MTQQQKLSALSRKQEKRLGFHPHIRIFSTIRELQVVVILIFIVHFEDKIGIKHTVKHSPNVLIGLHLRIPALSQKNVG